MQPRHIKEEAELTVKTVRDKLTYGSNNESDKDRADFLRGNFVRAAAPIAVLKNLIYGNSANFPSSCLISSLAITKYGYGNCGEQAEAAFIGLIEKGIYPIDYCSTTLGKHCLLVVGRDPASDKNDMSTWGDHVFICDPWINKVYPLSEFQKMQHETSLGQYNKIIFAGKNLPPHYLIGTIKIEESVKNEKDFIKFRQDMKLHPDVRDMLAPILNSTEALQRDARKLQQDFEFIKKSPYFSHPKAQKLIVQIEGCLAAISLNLNEEKKPAKSTKSNFKGSVVTNMGDAYSLLIAQLNAAIQKDSIPKDFAALESSINKREYAQAVRRVCNFKDVARARPLLEILLQFKNRVTFNLDAQAGEDKYAAIHYAAMKVAEHGDRSLYDLLVKHGAHEDLLDNHEKSAAQYLQESLTKFDSLRRKVS